MAKEVTPDIFCMYFLQWIITNAKSQIGILRISAKNLKMHKIWVPSAYNYRIMMLFLFSADRNFEEIYNQ